MFNERTGTPFNAVQLPTDIVLMAVVWWLRYKLSLRDLVELFAVKGYNFSYETVRDWEARFGPLLAKQLRAKRCGQAGKSWYVDETYVKVKGNWCYLYRAIDRDGNLVDTMLSEKRDLPSAKAFFKQAIATVGHKPDRVTTDKQVGVAGIGDKSKYLPKGCVDLGIYAVSDGAAFLPHPPWLVFACQTGGNGISNKSLTRHRRRARPAAIAGVLER